jgi:heme/copper-type cytochrome/quinol oxidase subunit 1
MAGMHRTGVQGFHVRYGTLKLLFRRIQQMKATYNINHPIIATDLFCVFYNVADSSMGTPRDNDQTIWRFIG